MSIQFLVLVSVSFFLLHLSLLKEKKLNLLMKFLTIMNNINAIRNYIK